MKMFIAVVAWWGGMKYFSQLFSLQILYSFIGFFFFSGIILNEVYTVFSVSSDGKNNTSPFGLCTEFLERSRKEQSS